MDDRKFKANTAVIGILQEERERVVENREGINISH